MPEYNKTEEVLLKLAPCIERGELEKCVEEAARVAREMGVGTGELLKLSFIEGMEKNKYALAYVLALTAEQGLDEHEKWRAYFGAGFAAQNIEKFESALEYYRKAIYLNPNESGLHFLFAGVLYSRKQKNEAEKHFKTAIEIEPKNAQAHALYGIFLLVENKVEESSRELTLASELAVKEEDIKLIHVLRGTINNFFSEISINQKNYQKSSEFASIAGDEYLNAAKTAEGGLKENLLLLGNILKAKSFVRKVPRKSWYKKLLYRLGKNRNISEVIDNLKNAAVHYEKASLCTIGDKQGLYKACYSTISVFSDVLSAMSALINDENPPINKNAWLSSLKQPREIYVTNKLNNGVALVDTLEQLINCADELSNQRASGVNIQEYFKKCYDNLIEVSTKLDGALKVITYQSVDAIKDYLKTKGMGFVGEEPKKSGLSNWIKEIRAAVAVIIAAAIVDWIFSLNLLSRLISFIKSLVWGTP
ncbi:MAG: tetratricopeptide repeat protein [Candidatus Methanoperedens sp.]